jgi:hypothetical protein
VSNGLSGVFVFPLGDAMMLEPYAIGASQLKILDNKIIFNP